MRRKRLLLLIPLVLVLLCVWVVYENTDLMRTDIAFVSAELPDAFDGFCILQVSDLHDAEIGKDNARLIAMAEQAAPDIIVLTGDIIDFSCLNIPRSLHAAVALAALAPTYYVTGNHEASISTEDRETFLEGLRGAGIHVLEDECVLLERGGASISLIGLTDIGQREGSVEEKEKTMEAALADMASEEIFDLVLSHRPELLSFYTEGGAELVLCGHAHGGQVRLPFVGGLFAPGQGLFPQYTAGIYTQDGTSMIVSRGIGNSSAPLRVNNRPELVRITLGSEKITAGGDT